MTDKKLNEKELEKVSGGLSENSGRHVHNPVDDYSVGNYSYLFFVNRSTYSLLFYARVIKSYEKSMACDTSRRVHEVEIIDKSFGVNLSGIVTIEAKDWAAYEDCFEI